MSFIRPATPGFIVTLVATILLAIVTFCVPYIKSVYFLRASITEGSFNGSIIFGTLGYCLELSNGTTCSKPSLGYELGQFPPFHWPHFYNLPVISKRHQWPRRQQATRPDPSSRGQVDHLCFSPPYRRPRGSSRICFFRTSCTHPWGLNDMLQHLYFRICSLHCSARIHIWPHPLLHCEGED